MKAAWNKGLHYSKKKKLIQSVPHCCYNIFFSFFFFSTGLVAAYTTVTINTTWTSGNVANITWKFSDDCPGPTVSNGPSIEHALCKPGRHLVVAMAAVDTDIATVQPAYAYQEVHVSITVSLLSLCQEFGKIIN